MPQYYCTGSTHDTIAKQQPIKGRYNYICVIQPSQLGLGAMHEGLQVLVVSVMHLCVAGEGGGGEVVECDCRIM